MKIYVIMCLGELFNEKYYTEESDVAKKVEKLNELTGGDFWYKELTQ